MRVHIAASPSHSAPRSFHPSPPLSLSLARSLAPVRVLFHHARSSRLFSPCLCRAAALAYIPQRAINICPLAPSGAPRLAPLSLALARSDDIPFVETNARSPSFSPFAFDRHYCTRSSTSLSLSLSRVYTRGYRGIFIYRTFFGLTLPLSL